MNIKKQSSAQQMWTDETGTAIPYNRTTQPERLREKMAYSLAKDAIRLHNQLKEFKQTVNEVCDEVVASVRLHHKIKTDNKGNFTWYNFDQSIKIEVSVNDLIRFDETLIAAAKEMLEKLIKDNINGDDFIKSIVSEAFQTSTGRLDTRRILGLKKHSSRISNRTIKTKWEEAMTLIDQSISRPESRTYFRLWVKGDKGEYESIDLNFSSIKP